MSHIILQFNNLKCSSGPPKHVFEVLLKNSTHITYTNMPSYPLIQSCFEKGCFCACSYKWATTHNNPLQILVLWPCLHDTIVQVYSIGGLRPTCSPEATVEWPSLWSSQKSKGQHISQDFRNSYIITDRKCKALCSLATVNLTMQHSCFEVWLAVWLGVVASKKHVLLQILVHFTVNFKVQKMCLIYHGCVEVLKD